MDDEMQAASGDEGELTEEDPALALVMPKVQMHLPALGGCSDLLCSAKMMAKQMEQSYYQRVLGNRAQAVEEQAQAAPPERGALANSIFNNRDSPDVANSNHVAALAQQKPAESNIPVPAPASSGVHTITNLAVAPA